MAGPTMQRVSTLVSKDIGNYLTNQQTWGGIIYNVKAYGAKGDGTTDDTSEIQSAIDAAGLAGGGIVFFPEGTYLISSALTVYEDNVVIQGIGNGTKISTNNLTADIFTVGDGISPATNVQLKDFRMDATSIKTAGNAIRFNRGFRCKVENVHMAAQEDTSTIKLYDGIFFDRFDFCTVIGGTIVVRHVGVKCRGHSDGLEGAGIFLDGLLRIISINLSGSIGVHIGGASGVVIGSVDIINNETGILIDDTLQPGVFNREVFIGSDCTVDGSGGTGILCADNSASHIDITGTWISSNGFTNPDGTGIGVSPTQTAFHMKVTGARFFNNRGGGVVVNGGGFQLTGCFFKSNGLGANGGHGVWVPNANATNFSVSGCIITDNGTAAKGTGILIDANVDNYSITGNIVRNNLQAQITDNGLANKVVANNLTT